MFNEKIEINNERLFKQIGKKIRSLRESKGHSMNVSYKIREIYDVKLDPSYLSRLERGKVRPVLGTLNAITHFYQVPLIFLFENTEESETLSEDVEREARPQKMTQDAHDEYKREPELSMVS